MSADRIAEIRARADAMTVRAIRDAAQPAFGEWLEAVEDGSVDTEEIVDALAVGGVTWRIVMHAREDVPALLAALDDVLALCDEADADLHAQFPSSQATVQTRHIRDAIAEALGGAS